MKLFIRSFAFGLLVACLAVAGLLAAVPQAQVAAQQNAAPTRDPGQVQRTHVADGFTIAAVGDLIHRYPINQFSEVKAVIGMMRDADIRIANCESSIVDFTKNKLTGGAGGMAAEPSVAADLKALGINLVGRANNHTFDWGMDGIRETDRNLDEAGVKHAGTGESLLLARQATFYDTSKGRVGMVDMATNLFTNVAGFAGNPVDGAGFPARPGLSMLRTTKYVIVTASEMEALKKIHGEHNEGLSLVPGLPAGGVASSAPATSDELLLFGQWYKVGDKPGATYAMNPQDRREILQSIRNGKGFSDFIVATMHVHEEPDCVQPSAGSAWKCGKPADFLEKFAHEAIDAGADMWAGTGPHVLLGIEIYKGRPIFYSLGNFTWQIELNQARRDGGDEAKGISVQDASERFWSYYNRDETMEESVIAISRYDKNELSEIRLYPIDLGWSRRPADRGVPWLASSEMAQKILQRLQKMSAPYGTTIAIEKNVGVIHVAAQSSKK